jgi:hypothetical protein
VAGEVAVDVGAEVTADAAGEVALGVGAEVAADVADEVTVGVADEVADAVAGMTGYPGTRAPEAGSPGPGLRGCRSSRPEVSLLRWAGTPGVAMSSLTFPSSMRWSGS